MIQRREQEGEFYLFDSLRQKWVLETPEERVRQHFIRYLVDVCGYPSSLIVIEKQMNQLPHLLHSDSIPTRRVDILCYAKQKEGLQPLLLVECKACPLGRKEREQIIGYNDFVEAKALVLVNQDLVLNLLAQGPYTYQDFIEGVPSYEALKHVT